MSTRLPHLPAPRAFRLAAALALIAWLTLSGTRAGAQQQIGKMLVAQTGHGSSGIERAAISPDGRFLATGTFQAALLWDTATGLELRCFPVPDAAPGVIAFDPQQRLLAATSRNRVFVWSVESGESVGSFDAGAHVAALAVGPDGRRFAVTFAEVESDKPGGLALRAGLTGKAVVCATVGPIEAVAFDRTAARAASWGPDDGLRVWDAATGTAEWKAAATEVRAVAFSPDGAVVTALTSDRAVRFDARTGRELGTVTVGLKRVKGIALAWDGTALTATDGDRLEVWDVANNHRNVEIATPLGGADALAISSGARVVAVAEWGQSDFALWEPKEGRPPRTVTSRATEVFEPVFDPTGARLAVTTQRYEVSVWDLRHGAEAYRVPGWKAAFSPDGALLAAEVPDERAVILYDARTGRVSTRLPGARFPVAFHPTKPLVAASDGTRIQLWAFDGAKAKAGRVLAEHGTDPIALQFSADGAALTSVTPKAITRSAVETGEVQVRTEGDRWGPPVAFSPDGTLVAAAKGKATTDVFSQDGPPLGVYEVATGQLKLDLKTRSNGYLTVGFRDGDGDLRGRVYVSARGARAASHPSGSFWAEALIGKCTIRIVRGRLGEGEHVANLVSFQDGGWAVADQDGRFDGSNGGDVPGLHWVVGTEPIELVQLKDRYFDPGLLAKHLGQDAGPLLTVRALAAPQLPPVVELVAPTRDRPTLGVTLTGRGGGFGRVVVLVNGKLAREIAPGAVPRGPNADTRALTVDLGADPRVEAGKENRVEVLAYNEAGYLRSRDAEVVFIGPGPVDDRPPEFWLVAVGVSDYIGTALDLRYAAKDARGFGAAAVLAAQRLFDPDGKHTARIHSAVLSSLEAKDDRKPTKANLKRSLGELASARPGDVVVIYLSGHGVSRKDGDADEYYFLTADARSADLTDPAVRDRDGLSGAELRNLLAACPARRQVLVLDTCAAGRAVDRLADRRAPLSEQVRALERVKDRTGTFILAGCAADAVSYEAGRYAQGVLTHALLLGMRTELVPGGEVNVGELFKFAVDRVPELAGHIGGIQRPQVGVPRAGAPFPIGLLTGADRLGIPLEKERPLVQRTAFQEETTFDDVFDLGKGVDEVLRAEAGRAVVFVDSKDVAGALRVFGRYQLDGEKVTVRVKVYEGKTELAAVTVTGDSRQLDDLAKAIARKVEEIGTAPRK